MHDLEENDVLLAMSWKNIWRNKTRSLILITAIAVGLLGGLIASGVSFGMGKQMIRSAILTRLSHIQIHHPQFAKDHDIEFIIPNAEARVDTLESLPRVSAAAARVKVSAMASSAVTASGVELFGIHPPQEQQLTLIDESVVTGSYFSTDTRNPVVIGQELAKTLDVAQNAKVVFTFQDSSGDLVGGAFKVVGIFKTVSSEFDKSTAFVKAQDLQRLLGISSSSYQEIAILLNENASLDSSVHLIESLVPSMDVTTWKTLAPDLDYVATTLTTSLYIFMLVIILALAFGIINTMLMVVLERRRELGMLMAVGMHRRTIFGMIVLETIVLTFTGAITGILLTLITMSVLSTTGIDLSYFAQGLSEFGISEILYPSLPLRMYGILAVMVTLTAITAAIYPAIRALRQKPAEALRV